VAVIFSQKVNLEGKMVILSHLCLWVTHSQVDFISGSSLSKSYFNREIKISLSPLFDGCDIGTVHFWFTLKTLVKKKVLLFTH